MKKVFIKGLKSVCCQAPVYEFYWGPEGLVLLCKKCGKWNKEQSEKYRETKKQRVHHEIVKVKKGRKEIIVTKLKKF